MRKTIFSYLIITLVGLAILPKAQGVFARNDDLCKYAGAQASACQSCMKDGLHTWTALGCIGTSPSDFIGNVLGIGVSIGGGIAFLLILFGGFQIITSAGNPEQLNEGRELVGSAITGLLFIVFSLFLLRLIGFQIFHIPGFG